MQEGNTVFPTALWYYYSDFCRSALEGVAHMPSALSPLGTMMQSMFWGGKEPGKVTGCPSCAASVLSHPVPVSGGRTNPCQISAWFKSSGLEG